MFRFSTMFKGRKHGPGQSVSGATSGATHVIHRHMSGYFEDTETWINNSHIRWLCVSLRRDSCSFDSVSISCQQGPQSVSAWLSDADGAFWHSMHLTGRRRPQSVVHWRGLKQRLLHDAKQDSGLVVTRYPWVVRSHLEQGRMLA